MSPGRVPAGWGQGEESVKSACRVWTRVRVREGCWPAAD